jgi:WD40 repeat protein
VFSPDGRLIATACLDRTAQLWDAATGQALTPPLRHEVPVERVHFSSDGERLFTKEWSGAGRIWDSGTGRPLSEWLRTRAPFGAVFDPDRAHVIMGATNGIVGVWHLPDLPLPVPEWFPEFAEAMAGIRLTERGAVELLPSQHLKTLVQRPPAKPAVDEYERIAQRFR